MTISSSLGESSSMIFAPFVPIFAKVSAIGILGLSTSTAPLCTLFTKITGRFFSLKKFCSFAHGELPLSLSLGNGKMSHPRKFLACL